MLNLYQVSVFQLKAPLVLLQFAPVLVIQRKAPRAQTVRLVEGEPNSSHQTSAGQQVLPGRMGLLQFAPVLVIQWKAPRAQTERLVVREPTSPHQT